jgi:hypothetical protein
VWRLSNWYRPPDRDFAHRLAVPGSGVNAGVVGRAAAESPGAGSELLIYGKTGSGTENEGGVKTKTRVYAVLKPARYRLRIEQKSWSRYQRAPPDPFDVRNPQNGFDPLEEIEQHQDAVLIMMQAAIAGFVAPASPS